MRALLVITAFLLSACATKPLGPVESLAKQGKKRYVVWSKSQFVKASDGKISGMSAGTLGAILNSTGGRYVTALDRINGFIIEAPVTSQISSSGSDWQITPEVEYHTFQSTCQKVTPITCPVTPGPTPDPTPTPTPQPIEVAKSWGITRVRANEAKAVVDTSNVKVCIVDTGTDLNHPNKGAVIGSIGYAGAVQDGNGHGTHTSGTVGGTGGVGVSRAKLLICKGLSDSGSGSSIGLAQCLTWCGAQGAQIVSNSWGSSQSDPLINQAITSLTQKGIYVFVANGNDGGPVNWPARLAGSNPLVYAVAASTQSDTIASFSSRGDETRYIAPGTGIISNWPGGSTRALDGTSMATPHAAGVCAYGVARGLKPCIKTNGSISGYPVPDALTTAQ